MSRRECGRALAVSIVAASLAACASPGSVDARRQALALLDGVATAAAADLAVEERRTPVQVGPCAWIPGWPTTKVAWEASYRYAAGEPASTARVERVIEHVRAQGGSVVADGEHPRLGRSVRLALEGADIFASARPTLELRVRSRCFEPDPPG